MKILTALFLFAGAALADDRVLTQPYDETAVVQLTGRENYQSAVVFGTDEKIENVAVGDSTGWQVTPNKRASVLFLKPLGPHARTNMTVVTDKRVYSFDLLTAAKASAGIYTLRFSYPAPPPEAKPAQGDFNFAWQKSGAKALFPAEIFSDEKHIYLHWPKDTPLPAILSKSVEGREGPVNTHVDGEMVTVDGPAKTLVLRLGKDVATLTNATIRSEP
ncbi:type IV secretion system protein VirB9 [Rhizomicrobium palustre]|uniref:Type IV secretion system protein VirB9 n=1 Tax=Rhizomicrobium palustre TaxID=189966 RepID=A0A846N1H7_9PROT|nr:TrbG/VirB9 family P-type conjugative transfer protein [Rhizomicrobium palustre]NIK89824.1 type IV secretion system protein VirB9 [Rhizomicrobium palustre]